MEPEVKTKETQEPARENPGKKEEPKVTQMLAPKDLASTMGISPKRLRAMLRAEYPREVEARGKKWEIPASLAKKVAKDYKAKKVAKEATKKAEIASELAGEGED